MTGDLLNSKALAVLLGLVMLFAVGCGETAEDPVEPPPEDPDVGEEPDPGEEPPAEAEEPTAVRVANLSFASRTTPIVGVIEAQGIAEEHGFDIEVVTYADGAAYYAGIAAGEVDVILGGVGVFQSMYNQGVPIQIISTAAGFNAEVFTLRDDINSLEDLEGRTLAATTAFSEYQNMFIVAQSRGVDLINDVTVIDTQPPDIVTQMRADRVDAGLHWDPGASLLQQEIPELRVIYDAAEGWEELTGLAGWELVQAARQSWLDEVGEEGVLRWLDVLTEATEFIDENPQEAGDIFAEITGFPTDLYVGIIEAEGFTGNFKYGINPIWMDPHPEEMFAQFRAATQAGFAERVPDQDVLFSP